jgi:hypothetical protein
VLRLFKQSTSVPLSNYILHTPQHKVAKVKEQTIQQVSEEIQQRSPRFKKKNSSSKSTRRSKWHHRVSGLELAHLKLVACHVHHEYPGGFFSCLLLVAFSVEGVSTPVYLCSSVSLQGTGF